MDVVIAVVLPVFGLIGVGYAVSRVGLLTAVGLQGLTNYTFYVAFSALLFDAMRKVRLASLEPHILAGYFAGSLGMFALALIVARFVFRLRPSERAFMALGSTFSNGVGLGIPLALSTWGQAGLVPLLMIVAIHSLILLTLASLLVELDNDSGHLGARIWASVVAMARHPVLIAIFAGLAWGATGIALPGVVQHMLSQVSASAAPCALVGLGASLATIRPGRGMPETLAMCAIKLLLLPLCVFVMTHYVFALPPLWVAVATLYGALPTGANVYLLAQRYGVYVARSTSMVLVSTGLSLFTLSVLLALLAPR